MYEHKGDCVPKECVVLDSSFPQPLGHLVIGQFERYRVLKLLELKQITHYGLIVIRR